MSDYISKSALIEELKEQKDDNDISCRLCMDSMIEIVEEQPTVDEKEIIRKTVERIIERLEEEKRAYEELAENTMKKPFSMDNSMRTQMFLDRMAGFNDSIEICKEEGGLNE